MNRIAELGISIEYDKSADDINKFFVIYECIHQILAENDILQKTVDEYKEDPNNIELNLKYNLHRGSINHYFQELMKIYDGNIKSIIKKFEEMRIAERNLKNSLNKSPKEHILNLLVHNKRKLNAPSPYMNRENRMRHYEKHPNKLYDEYRKNLNEKLFTDLSDNYMKFGLSENVVNYIQKNRYMKWFYYTFYSAILKTTLIMGQLLLFFIDPNNDVYFILKEKLEYIHTFTSVPANVLEKRMGFEYSVFTESNLLFLFKDLYSSFVDLIKTTVLPNLVENKMNPINISRLLSIHEETDPNLYFSILNIYIDSVRFYQDIQLVNYEKLSEANEAGESISLIILREILVFCRLFYKKINYFYPFKSSLLCLDEKYLSLPLTQDEFIKVINFYIIQLLVLQNQYYIYFSLYNYGLVKYFRELMYVDYELRFLSFSQDVGGKSNSEIKNEIFILKETRNNLIEDVKKFVIEILINNDEKLSKNIEECPDEQLKILLRKYYENIKIFIEKMSDYFKISLIELIKNLSSQKVLGGHYAIESPHFNFRTYKKLKYSDLIIKLEETNNILSKNIDQFLKIPIDYYANFFAYGENSHLLFDIYQNMSIVEIIILSREFQQNLSESENLLNIIKENFERLLLMYRGYIPPEKKIVDIIRYQIAFFMSRENIYYYHCKSKEWANQVFEKYMNKNVKFIKDKPETATVNKNTSDQFIEDERVSNFLMTEFIEKKNLNNIKRNINGIKLGKLKKDDIEKYKKIFKKSIPDSLANEAKKTQYETRKKMFLKKYPYE